MDINPNVLQGLLEADLNYTSNPFLASDTSISDARALWLKNSFLKKFEGDSSMEADKACLSKFLAVNDKCGVYNYTPSDNQVELIVNQAKANIYDEFHSRYNYGQIPTIDRHDIMAAGGCGPGASIGVKIPNFFKKMFASELTHTDPALLAWYEKTIHANPRWAAAERRRQSIFGSRVVASSNLSFVPKNREISRSICTEPVLNMFLQKGIGSAMLPMLQRFHDIDIEKVGNRRAPQQEVNRRMACEGSISGKYSTIDLSSASDSLSITMIRQIFPSYFVKYLEETRCKTTRLPDGTVVELNMISSMGNGYTFALQTYLFASIVKAAYQILGIRITRGSGRRNYSVFGDDIICLTEAYGVVTRVLSVLGMTVNDDKSFAAGNFRESCGGDYFQGHAIRGVYLKKCYHVSHVYSIVNRLNAWTAMSGIPLPSLVKYLVRSVRFRPVPYDAGDSEGFKIPSSMLSNAQKRDKNGSLFYHALKRETSTYIPNPSERTFTAGLIISAVGGYARDDGLPIRPTRETYRVAKCITPYWDGMRCAGLTDRDWIVWELSVAMNIQ